MVGKKADGKPEYLTFYYTDQYAEHWANLWTVWLMSRTGHQTYREQMHSWLGKQFVDKHAELGSRPFSSVLDFRFLAVAARNA